MERPPLPANVSVSDLGDVSREPLESGDIERARGFRYALGC